MKHLILIFLTTAMAEKAPVWVGKKQFADAEAYYFVESLPLVEMNDPNERQRVRLAAQKDALRMVVGTRTQFQTESAASTQTENLTQIAKESFPTAPIKGFTESDVYLNDDHQKAYLLYRWSKADAQAMQIGQGSISQEQIDLQTEISTEYFFDSNPQKAAVYIDGVRWGETPLLLKDKIEIGSHKITLDHPYSETLEFDHIFTQKKQSLSRLLKPLAVLVDLNSDPKGASVHIDGDYQGMTPLSLTVAVTSLGKIKKILLQHPKAYPQEQYLEVSKNMNRFIEMKMALKPSFIHVGCEPSPCTLRIDDEAAVEIKGRFIKRKVSDGHHKIVIQKTGFQDVIQEHDVEAGQILNVGSIRLQSVTEKTESKIASVKNENEDHFNLALLWNRGDFILGQEISYTQYQFSYLDAFSPSWAVHYSLSYLAAKESFYEGYPYHAYGYEWSLGIFAKLFWSIRFGLYAGMKSWNVDFTENNESLKARNGYVGAELRMPMGENLYLSLQQQRSQNVLTQKTISHFSLGVGYEF